MASSKLPSRSSATIWRGVYCRHRRAVCERLRRGQDGRGWSDKGDLFSERLDTGSARRQRRAEPITATTGGADHPGHGRAGARRARNSGWSRSGGRARRRRAPPTRCVDPQPAAARPSRRSSRGVKQVVQRSMLALAPRSSLRISVRSWFTPRSASKASSSSRHRTWK